MVFFCKNCTERYFKGLLSAVDYRMVVIGAVKVHKRWKCRACARTVAVYPALERSVSPEGALTEHRAPEPTPAPQIDGQAVLFG